MSSRNDVDERFEDLVRQLRAGREAAPTELRERVSAIAAQAPEPKPQRAPFAERFRLKRAGLILVPACVVAATSAALVHGLASSGSNRTAAADQRGVVFAPVEPTGSFQRKSDNPTALNSGNAGTSSSKTESAVAPPPSARLQDYRVSMRVRVTGLDAMSHATVRAMRVTRSLGGYVANVEYSSPNVRHGDAVLILRVPIANAQKAVLAFAGLGTLVAQHFTVIDVQKAYDAQVEQVAKLRFKVAKLNAQIKSGALSGVDLANAKEQLEYSRLSLHRLVTAKRTTLNHARLSTLRLSLTTFHPKRKHVVPAVPSHFNQQLGDAGRVLGHEVIWVLYALVVGGPLALFGLFFLGVERSRRRRAERRFLAATP